MLGLLSGPLGAYTRLDLGYYGIGGGSFSNVSGATKSATSSQGLALFGQYGVGQELGGGAFIEERIGVGPLGQYATESSSIQGTLMHLQVVSGWAWGIVGDRFQVGFGVPLGAGILLGQAASANASSQGIVFIPVVGGLFRFEGALNARSSVGLEAGYIETVASPFSISGPIIAVTWRRGGTGSRSAAERTAPPRTPYQRIVEGEAAYRARQYDVAEKAFADATEDATSNARAWQDLGNAEYAMGEVKAAIRAYRRALKLDPGNSKLDAFVNKIQGR